ncbi:peptidylprolyl isomerase [Patescibacteria group bacterium]
MKSFSKISLGLIVSILFVSMFSGCADITKSKDYKTYKLKYQVNLTNISDEEKEEAVKKTQSLINKRIHSFDVANVNLTRETEGEKTVIAAEFGTIDDVNEVKQEISRNDTLVIRTQVEVPEDYQETLKEKAQSTLQTLLDGADFESTAQNDVLSDPERILYSTGKDMYRDEIKEVFAEKLFDMEPGTVYSELIEYDEFGGPLAPPIPVAAIIKLIDKKEVDRITEYAKEVKSSHILIAYQDAMRASEEVTRSKEEAFAFAEEIKRRVDNSEDFVLLAREYSDDASNKMSGGVLETPAGHGIYAEQFEIAALALEEDGQISEITETQFGYHIIKAEKVTPYSEDSHKEIQVSFGILFYALLEPKWENTELTGEYLKKAETFYNEDYDPYTIITFNREGKELLEKVTDENYNEIIAVFTGQKLRTSFIVENVNYSGEIKILQPSTTKEADELLEALYLEPLPAPIILIEEEA